MKKQKLSILTLRLLDLPLANNPKAALQFIGAAKDLLRAYPEQTRRAGVDPQLFHDDRVRYSAIQLSRYQGAATWTGYGAAAVDALWYWLELFQATAPETLDNLVIIQEHYQPDFLPQAQNYHITPLVLSKKLSQSLDQLPHSEQRHDRLAKYLYGNLQTFFKAIDYQFNKEEHFLRVGIQKVQACRRLPVFHQHRRRGLDIYFQCNFRLPQTLRLGQSTALGYGRVRYV